MLTKRKITIHSLIIQLLCFGFLLFLIVGNEVFDFPHTLFGQLATPINWTEILIEAIAVIVLGAVCVGFSIRYLSHIKYLEGYLPICASCKKIRENGEWVNLEKFFSEKSSVLFSHGLCPDCAKKFSSDE